MVRSGDGDTGALEPFLSDKLTLLSQCMLSRKMLRNWLKSYQ
jgi:hypothetical protein